METSLRTDMATLLADVRASFVADFRASFMEDFRDFRASLMEELKPLVAGGNSTRRAPEPVPPDGAVRFASSTPISDPEIEIVHSHLYKARCKQVVLKSTAVTGGVQKRRRSRRGNIGSLATCKHLKGKVSFQRLVAEIAQVVKADWRFQTVVPSLLGSTVSVQSNLASNSPVSGTGTSIHNLSFLNESCDSVFVAKLGRIDVKNEEGEYSDKKVKVNCKDVKELGELEDVNVKRTVRVPNLGEKGSEHHALQLLDEMPQTNGLCSVGKTFASIRDKGGGVEHGSGVNSEEEESVWKVAATSVQHNEFRVPPVGLDKLNVCMDDSSGVNKGFQGVSKEKGQMSSLDVSSGVEFLQGNYAGCIYGQPVAVGYPDSMFVAKSQPILPTNSTAATTQPHGHVYVKITNSTVSTTQLQLLEGAPLFDLEEIIEDKLTESNRARSSVAKVPRVDYVDVDHDVSMPWNIDCGQNVGGMDSVQEGTIAGMKNPVGGATDLGRNVALGVPNTYAKNAMYPAGSVFLPSQSVPGAMLSGVDMMIVDNEKKSFDMVVMDRGTFGKVFSMAPDEKNRTCICRWLLYWSYLCHCKEKVSTGTRNACLNGDIDCLTRENKMVQGSLFHAHTLEKLILLLANELETIRHQFLLHNSADAMFVGKDGNFISLKSKLGLVCVVEDMSLELALVEFLKHISSQGLVYKSEGQFITEFAEKLEDKNLEALINTATNLNFNDAANKMIAQILAFSMCTVQSLMRQPESKGSLASILVDEAMHICDHTNNLFGVLLNFHHYGCLVDLVITLMRQEYNQAYQLTISTSYLPRGQFWGFTPNEAACIMQVISTIASALAQFTSGIYRHFYASPSTLTAALTFVHHEIPQYHLLDLCRNSSAGDIYEGNAEELNSAVRGCLKLTNDVVLLSVGAQSEASLCMCCFQLMCAMSHTLLYLVSTTLSSNYQNGPTSKSGAEDNCITKYGTLSMITGTSSPVFDYWQELKLACAQDTATNNIMQLCSQGQPPSHHYTVQDDQLLFKDRICVPPGLIQPNTIPEGAWKCISLDLIEGLPSPVAEVVQRFFGPLQVEQNIGTVAFKLKLPPSSTVHPVFHVSLLKGKIGNAPVTKWLIQWLGSAAEKATWEEADDSLQRFPDFKV